MGFGERLDSWKAIAAHLKRDESTVRRWEKEGLPVHRHLHAKKASVYAYSAEIDLWWNNGGGRLAAERALRPRRRFVAALSICLVLLSVGAGWIWLSNRATDRLAPQPITSIAVLPLENLSGDPQQDYFADGVTEALINELGKAQHLRVISRSSVMSYRGRKTPLKNIARELKVGAIVEGAISREGTRVRVTARLVGVQPERQLWAERYERDVSSILALQVDLALAIAGEVHAKLKDSERARLSGPRAVDPEAYEAYLKGRFQWNKSTPESLQKARGSFEEAIRKDPTFAPAYAGLADTYAWTYRFPAAKLQPPHVVFPKAKSAVHKALELDDTLVDAHLSLALIKELYDWDWDGAERAYLRAIAMNPNSAMAHEWYARFLCILRRYEDAFAHIGRAEDLDPLSRRIRNTKGYLYLWSGQFDHALQLAKTLLELEPDYGIAHYYAGLAYVAKGMYSDAIAAQRRAMAQSGETARSLAFLAHALGKSGQRAEALEIISELTERARHTFIPGYQLAIAHIGLDNKDEALHWLERSVEQRTEIGDLNRGGRIWLKALDSDPRYQSLIRRLRFPI